LYYDLANILSELDRRPEAIALIEAMPDGGEPRYDVCLWLAGAYNAQQRYDDSIAFLSQVEFSNWEGSSRPRDLLVAALMARGRRHYEAGRFRAALADFETALTYPPNLHVGPHYQRTDAETCYWLGKTRLAGGDERGAREAFRAGAGQVTQDDLPLPSIAVTDAQDEYVGRCAAALDVLAVKRVSGSR
jgi:tetratricopeptide (TPR) repeat protein